MTLNLITVTHADFKPYVGQTFTVQTEAGPVSLVLDNVKIFEKSTLRDSTVEIEGVVYPPRQAFALTFEGPKNPVLDSRVYKVMHEAVGNSELFLSAFLQEANCTLYEAVFN